MAGTVKQLETVKKAYRIDGLLAEPFPKVISVRLIELIRGKSGRAAVHIRGLRSVELRNLKGRRSVQLEIKTTVILRIPSSRPGPERMLYVIPTRLKVH